MKKTFPIILSLALLATTALLAGCSKNTTENTKGQLTEVNQSTKAASFSGTEGEAVTIEDSQIAIDTTKLQGTTANYYNTELSDGRTVYFFVVKDKNGTYRAAANACQVCADSKAGFHQEGDQMVCNTCGNGYPLEKIATEKGGCNPVPINPNLKVADSKIIIEQSDIEQIADFF
ncbi:DUF2318 domain-containing protein [Patescibacteria group bacterium]|nr:DUF2318 domain-containing protein [Patescibacteria group bacterium]